MALWKPSLHDLVGEWHEEMSGFQRQQAIQFFQKRRRLNLIVSALLFITAVGIWEFSHLGKMPNALSFLQSVFAIIIAIFSASFTILTAINNLVPLKFLLPQSESSQSKFNRIRWSPPSLDHIPSSDRQEEITKVYQVLMGPDVNALVITGSDGIGKSTLAALVCRYAEKLRLELSHRLFASKPLKPLWLKIDKNVTMVDLAGTLFEALNKTMPDFNTLSPLDQARELYNLLSTKTRTSFIVLDQFEHFLYGQTGQVFEKHQAIGEWLELLNDQKFKNAACRLLIISRSRVSLSTPGYSHIREHHTESLSTQAGIAFLRNQLLLYGVEEAKEENIEEAIERCDHHASALIYLAKMVKMHDMELAMILNDPLYEALWLGDVARNLLDYLYNHLLTDTQGKLLQAFSTYREAVPLKAAQVVMGASPGTDDFNVLYDQQLLSVCKGRYQPSAIVRGYIHTRFDKSTIQSEQQARQTTHIAAAHYYIQLLEEFHTALLPKQGTDNIHLLAEAVWHFCEAQQWQEAYSLMKKEGFFPDFKDPEKAVGLLDTYQILLLGNWQPDPLQKAHIWYNLATIYTDIGQKELARTYFENAISIWNEKGKKTWKGITLSKLGRVYSALGKKKEALNKYKEALDILKKTGERLWIGTTHSYLGRVYGSLEEYTQAQEAYKRALDYLKGENNQSIESITLSYLGVICCHLGRKEEGLNYCQRAVEIVKTTGEQRAAGRVINNLGSSYSIQGNYEQAMKCYQEALSISRKQRDRSGEGVILQNIGNMYNMQGKQSDAEEKYKNALTILEEVNDNWRVSMIYNDLGIIYTKGGLWNIAEENYKKARDIRKDL